MLTGYPFWSDALAPTTPTIYDPILMTAVTTLTFRGKSREQKLMGISVAGGTPTLGNSVRVKIGNSLPNYRYITVPLGGHDHNAPILPQIKENNYYDLGGLPILEGEALSISGQGLEGAAGTGAMAGVLWVEDGEPASKSIPNGNIICLVHGALAGGGDAQATLTDLTSVLDSRDLENNYLYTPYMVMVEPEDQLIEALLLRAGKDVMTLPPCGRMVYPVAPLQFTGLEYNSGALALWAQTAAAAGFIIYMYCIESKIANGPQPVNAPSIQNVTPSNIPGTLTVAQIIGPSTGIRPTFGGATATLRNNGVNSRNLLR